MARDGWWFVGPSAAVVLAGMSIGFAGGSWGWAVFALGTLAAVSFGFFFRDPERTIPADRDVILATADGRIVTVEQTDNGGYRIDTFLSVMDVHVNRAPVGGIVTQSIHRQGRFRAAFHQDAGADNERHDLTIESEYGTVRSAQIAGVLARRIVCRLRRNERVVAGQRIGIIKFGSRAQVLTPPGFETTVSLGDKVRAGETILARCMGHPRAAEVNS
ncbi:MAG TPA: phosphatidylserine decarboxylase [candidate division Zixibacteria bacterium]|jgi:phosphatidylserine decarboxylase